MNASRSEARARRAGWTLGLAVAAAAAGLAACTWTETRPKPPIYEKREPWPPLPSASAAASAAPASSVLVVEPEDEQNEAESRRREAAVQLVAAVAGPRIRVGDVRGASVEQAGVIFASVEEPIEACTAKGKGGVLALRVTTKASRTSLEVLPGTNVDDATRACVLKAMKGFEPGATMPQSSSPSEKLREFSSVLTIQW